MKGGSAPFCIKEVLRITWVVMRVEQWGFSVSFSPAVPPHRVFSLPRTYTPSTTEASMALAPFAVWHGPSPNRVVGGLQRPVMGLVLHIMDGTQAGTDSWFKNPQSQVSAHFGNAKDGRLWQWVDTNDRAWAQTAGNLHWVSVENEGHGGDSLTEAQLHNCALLMSWLHDTESVPLQLTDDPNRGGLGWHGMAGGVWGHPSCPGAPIVAQRQHIIDLATGVTDMPLTEAEWGRMTELVRTVVLDVVNKQGITGAADPRNGSTQEILKHGDANWKK